MVTSEEIEEQIVELHKEGKTSKEISKVVHNGADELAIKPMSPENTADKILMLLVRDKVAENKSQ